MNRYTFKSQFPDTKTQCDWDGHVWEALFLKEELAVCALLTSDPMRATYDPKRHYPWYLGEHEVPTDIWQQLPTQENYTGPYPTERA